MQPSTASLDPSDFRHVAAEPKIGFIQISQVDRGVEVREMSELHIPCACGRPLCGVDTEVIVTPRGHVLHFFGICLSCGRQSGIYMSKPAAVTADAEQALYEARLQSDIAAVIRGVTALREGAPEEVA